MMMSVRYDVPTAPPLSPMALFSRPRGAAAYLASGGGFRAKANPFHSPGSGSSRGGVGGSGGSGGGRFARSANASPETPWKAALKANCLQRVQQHRATLIQKMRDLPATNANTQGEHTAVGNAALAESVAAAHASLASSLRDIIDEQMRRRAPPIMPHQPSHAAAAAAAAPIHSLPMHAAPSPSGVLQSSTAIAAAAANSSSFTEADESLSPDEYIELMAHMQEEVMRDLLIEEEQNHLHDMCGDDDEYQYDDGDFADAELEAQIAAFEADSRCDSLPCPCCNRIITVSASSTSAGGVACACGLRYPCSSVSEFRSHLSDAVDLHGQRCRCAPKFVATPQTNVHAATLALACEPCQTWLSVPVHSTNGWHSQPHSQAGSQNETDYDMDL